MRLLKMILPLSVVLLLAGVLAAQNPMPPANQQSPDQQSNAAGQQNNGADQSPQTLIDPGDIYNAKKPGTWIGKTVTLKNVMVQDTNNSGNFWVGSDKHHRLLVVKPTSNLDMHAMRVKKGDLVTVTGEIQPASDALADKTGAEKNSMHDAENSSGVFLEANSLNIASSTGH
jgi:hypothetical protein